MATELGYPAGDPQRALGNVLEVIGAVDALREACSSDWGEVRATEIGALAERLFGSAIELERFAGRTA